MGIPYYYGTDHEYAQKRLSNTTVFDKSGGLFNIQDVSLDPTGKYLIFSGHNAAGESFYLRSEDLDMTPLMLGYTVLPERNYSAFLSRLPARSGYKQGLSFSSVSISHGSRGHLRVSHLEQPAKNIYPKFSKVKELVSGSIHYDLPFSRHFALSPKLDIVYRGRAIVGKVNKQGDAVLNPSFSYLQQHLDTVTK